MCCCRDQILGPDVGDVDYVAWVADQDAYACSGQKCSAQSIVFAHRKWWVDCRTRAAWAVCRRPSSAQFIIIIIINCI